MGRTVEVHDDMIFPRENLIFFWHVDRDWVSGFVWIDLFLLCPCSCNRPCWKAWTLLKDLLLWYSLNSNFCLLSIMRLLKATLRFFSLISYSLLRLTSHLHSLVINKCSMGNCARNLGSLSEFPFCWDFGPWYPVYICSPEFQFLSLWLSETASNSRPQFSIWSLCLTLKISKSQRKEQQ